MLDLPLSPDLKEQLTAAVEAGIYTDEAALVSDAVRTLLAARPELREAVACRLYERGEFSLGRAAEWSGLTIEQMKDALHRRGITREATDSVQTVEDLARQTLRAADRSSNAR